MTLSSKSSLREDGWERRLGRMSTDERRGLIEELDTWRHGDEAERDALRRVLIELAPTLDLADARDEERLRWAIEGLCEVTVDQESLYAHVRDHALDPAWRNVARVRVGQIVGMRGRVEEAHAALHAVLHRVRGTAQEAEGLACFVLARDAAMRGDWTTALACNRRAREVARVRDDPSALAFSLVQRLRVLSELRDWPRYDSELTAVLDAAGLASGVSRHQVLIDLQECRVNAALLRRQFDVARQLLRELERLWSSVGERAPARRVARMRLEANVGLEDAKGARAVLGTPDSVSAGRHDALHLSLVTARLLLLEGARDAARAEATSLLERLEGLDADGRAALGGALRTEWARALARLLLRCGDDDAVRRAWDAAASAVLERIVALDRMLGEESELWETAGEDLEILRDHRRDLVTSQTEVLEAALLALRRAAREGKELPSHPSGEGGEWLLVCAWCRRIRGAGGSWSPLLDYCPEPGGHERVLCISFGVCSDCREHALG